MRLVKLLAVIPALLGGSISFADGSGEHAHDEPSPTEMLDVMREMHADHDHDHGFEAMEDVSEEDMHRTMDLLIDIGLIVPTMDSHRGAEAFLDKGCIVCHSVNGVGGEIGPSFDADDMPQPMNVFDFAARMWRGAPTMAEMQEDLLGEMISLNGQELADIVAFVHDADVQADISQDDVPGEFAALMP